MRSSISASKSTPFLYAKILIAVVAILIGGIEIAAKYLLKHDSATYARVSQQYEQALKVQPAGVEEPPTVLIVGNSLLLHGIKLDRLQEMTATRMRVYPVFLEQTGYYDWLYGLRRLFRKGSRPDVVVVGVGVNYFLENGIRQDYSPGLFFDTRDTLAVASDLKLDRTATSNLFLAHFSTFWDTRSAIRTQVLSRAVPHLQNLFSLINLKPSVPNKEEFEALSVPRLQRLQHLCAQHGTKLILLLPPTLSSEGPISEMARTARQVGVEVSVPVDPTALTAKYFQPDGMHLNSDGAAIFTSALAKDLPERVANTNTLASHPRIRRDVHYALPRTFPDEDYTSWVRDSEF